VEKVALNFGKENEEWVDKMTLSEAKRHLEEGTHFAKGSMAPKIQACVWYLERGGGEALITDPKNVELALAGETGTRIVPD
jgi:carbamate kinase